MLLLNEQPVATAKLHELVATGIQRAANVDRPILVSLTVRVTETPALTLFDAARALREPHFYWEQPGRSFALVGIGTAYAIETSGNDRFAETKERWKSLRQDALIDGLDTMAGSGPTLLGGFRFDPDSPARDASWRNFPDGALVLPRLQWSCRRGNAALTFNLVVHADSRVAAVTDDIICLYDALLQVADGPHPVPARAEHIRFSDCLPGVTWQRLVGSAAAAISGGEFEKVVLARAVAAQTERQIDVAAALATLRTHYPSAYIFAVGRAEACFFGATPERLVGLHSGLVAASGLAGTAPRGTTLEADEQLAHELLGNAKNRHEHAVVVDMLRHVLGEACIDIHAPATPVVLKLPNVQHLWTPVTGRLRRGYSLLDLLGRLHPTPAVGGVPREAALAYIREHEHLDRGWYAGPVGWLDARGEGDWAVALRSGVVADDRAVLFAGCGIVAGSDPAAEYAETRYKLQPMIEALGATLV